MRHKKILFVAIAMLFSFNNAHAQFFKKLMKTVQEVGEVVTDITGETSNGTPVNNNTTTSSSELHPKSWTQNFWGALCIGVTIMKNG